MSELAAVNSKAPSVHGGVATNGVVKAKTPKLKVAVVVDPGSNPNVWVKATLARWNAKKDKFDYPETGGSILFNPNSKGFYRFRLENDIKGTPTGPKVYLPGGFEENILAATRIAMTMCKEAK